MSKFVAPVRRKQAGRNHYYVDGNGTRMPGVTTILGNGLPKSALVNWAGNATAEYAVDHWDELGDLTVAQRLKKLQGARYEDRDKAAKRGTEVHGIGERLVKGEQVQVPAELTGHAESYVKFLDDFDVEPILVEFVIASYRYGYAGTADLLADLTLPKVGKKRLLLDIKTNRTGIFGETALQLAAYRYADIYIDADGNEQPMIPVDGCAAIHVRADGYSLIPTVSGEAQLKDFRHVQVVGRIDSEFRDLLGAEIEPPHNGPIARVIYEESK